MAVHDYRNLRSDFQEVKLNFHLAHTFDCLFLSSYASQFLACLVLGANGSQGIEFQQYTYAVES